MSADTEQRSLINILLPFDNRSEEQSAIRHKKIVENTFFHLLSGIRQADPGATADKFSMPVSQFLSSQRTILYAAHNRQLRTSRCLFVIEKLISFFVLYWRDCCIEQAMYDIKYQITLASL
jgi:hypothetical protein